MHLPSCGSNGISVSGAALSPRNSKIVKERIRTRISISTCKIEIQPLFLDTDAPLHNDRMISVRQEAEFAHRFLPVTLHTFYRCGHKEFLYHSCDADTFQTSCWCDPEVSSRMENRCGGSREQRAACCWFMFSSISWTTML